MAEREIKITFPEVKMEALEFFLREQNTTVEQVLKEHLDKTYEKSVPQQVRKFVESKITLQQESVQEEEPQRQTRGQGRRSTRQNAVREAVSEQEDSGMQPTVEPEEPETGMVMEM